MSTTTLFLLLLLLLSSASAGAPGSCSSSSDCSLNGDCLNSTCLCDPWWSGSPACDVLSLLPANKSQGYHNASGVTSWGGMSIRDEAGAWHLFAAEMVNMCKLGSWTSNSRVVRGISTSGPAGPFDIVQGVSVPFSHNPKIFRAPDGTYLLFSIGSGLWQTTPESCEASEAALSPAAAAASASLSGPSSSSSSDYPGPCGDGCGGAPGQNHGCGLSLGSASSLEGPWTFAAINVTNQSQSALLDCAHTNPSPWIFPNGTIIMAINAGFCHGGLETIGLLTAPSYAGPWTWLNHGDPILHNSDGSIHHCEDPFLWVTERGFHLMVHNQQGSGVALYAHSLDALSWTLHNEAGNPGPYSDSIAWDDGSLDSFDVERPQFIFSPETGAPIFLTNGAQGSPTSFTLFRPLSQTRPPPPPPPAQLVNAEGLCLATAGAWPCWTAPAGFSTCPLTAGPCASAPLWQLLSDGSLVTSAASGEPLPVNLDCDQCSAGTVAKLISSGASPLALLAGPQQLQSRACGSSSPMCLTTGSAAGARKPCGGGSEPWGASQLHLQPCSSADTVGWRWAAS
jgi:hypothetical protein